ncbi:MAG TPA: hypothetical protein VKZ66_08775 [Pusillimonas sp.]|uniref:hypothetical protein n=1 Tax=unclassified Pusillimonas TaxID=2640016 RepID=UPI0026370F3D|nr:MULTISPECIES: hypothetical protein [unclassified Pusillimonas]HLU20038.1 hypothetical protein [Pusillimonas sp.]
MSIPTYSTAVHHASLAPSAWRANDCARGRRWRMGLIRHFDTNLSPAHDSCARSEQRIKASP